MEQVRACKINYSAESLEKIRRSRAGLGGAE